MRFLVELACGVKRRSKCVIGKINQSVSVAVQRNAVTSASLVKISNNTCIFCIIVLYFN